jgi:diadenosine tetraphosphate (Ap4A) HIT family hydrolase
MNCVYCANTTDKVIWSDAHCRVMFIDDSPFVGWCRVVWREHKEELTELSPAERAHFMAVTFAVEAGLLKLLKPAKINLASLGTGLRHVHWHVIPRFADDTHFPEPVWATPLRVRSTRTVPDDFVAAMRRHLDSSVASEK